MPFTHHSLTLSSVKVAAASKSSKASECNGLFGGLSLFMEGSWWVSLFHFLQLQSKPLQDWGRSASSRLQLVCHMGPRDLNYSPSTVITSPWEELGSMKDTLTCGPRARCFELHPEHLTGFLHLSTWLLPSHSLTVGEIKPPYLRTCLFSQGASPSVRVNLRTWPSPGSEFTQHHAKRNLQPGAPNSGDQRQHKQWGASTGWRPSSHSGSSSSFTHWMFEGVFGFLALIQKTKPAKTTTKQTDWTQHFSSLLSLATKTLRSTGFGIHNSSVFVWVFYFQSKNCVFLLI